MTTPHTRRVPQPQRATLTAVALTALAALVSPSPPPAQAGPLDDRCEITQVTDTTQDSVWDYGNQLNRESLSGDGTRLVFASNRNIAGNNPREVGIYSYVFDVATAATQPLASTPVGDPVISADGTRVAYSTSTGGGNPEIYAYDSAAQTTTQLTSDDHAKIVLSISADGSRILHLVDLVGAGGFDALQVLDTTVPSTINVAQGIGIVDQHQAVISPDGNTIAFVSRSDLTGDNPDGSAELHVFDTTTETLDQVTSSVAGPNGGGSAGILRFTDNGATLLFSSDAAVLGTNPTRAFLDYRYDVTTATVSSAPSPPFDLAGPGLGAWSPDGTRFQVASSEDPTGSNPEGNPELFSFDSVGGDLTQLTSVASSVHGSASGRSMSSNGTTIAFRATANLLGDNPDHNREIYLATTCDPPPQPDGSIATSATGPAVGDDVYSSAPRADQRATQTIARGATRRFFVHLQNDRDATDTLTLRGTHAGSAGYHVSYLHGRTDITAQVQAGTYTTGPLEPGDTATIKIKITATHTAGTGHRVDLAARSDTNPAARDTVRAKVTRT